MEFKKKTIIWEENTEPPKNYFWVKPDGKVYEYTLEAEDWVESEEIQLKEGEYSTEEPSSETTGAIEAYEQKQETAGKPINPTATITVDYTAEESVPETVVLPETTHPMTLKGDYSQNENTTFESTGEIEKVNINNTGDPANVTIDLPSSTVTLSGKYNTVLVKAVSEDTLNVSTGCKIKTLIVMKGTAVVNNAFVEDNVETAVEIGGTIKANDPIVANTSASQSTFVGKPRILTVEEDVQTTNLSFTISANGHYVWNLNGHVVDVIREGYGGVLVRGGVVLLDIFGPGEFKNHGTKPTVWCSDKESTINIYGGKFTAVDNNECVYSENGTINIYDGEFHNNCPAGTKSFLLNCKDANYTAGTAKIYVYGGKFYGFNPANCETEGPNTNFVAEGYTSVDRGEYFEVIKDE